MAMPSPEDFPDLHQKMSKKIAQLTKVIYHLNTRNEDHQSELDAIAYNHQQDTQQLMRDAANKIGKFKDLVEIRKVADAQEIQMGKLQKKHELEKLNALQDFEAYKARVTDMAQRSNHDYQEKFEAQEETIKKMNQMYQEKITSFEVSKQELSKLLESAKSNGSTGLNEMKSNFEKEVKELNRVNKESYQKMLEEQLRVQESIREEHEKNLSAAVRGVQDAARAEAEQALGLVRAQLAGDKQESLMTLRRELEEKAQAQRDLVTDKIEKLRSELAAKTRDCESVSLEKNRLSEELSARLADMEVQMGRESGGRLKEMSTLKEHLLSATENVNILRAKIEEREEEIARLEGLLKEKNEAIHRHEGVEAALRADVTRLEEEQARFAQSGASTEKSLKERAAAGERESNGLRAEVNQMAATLAQIREELKISEKNLQKSTSESLKTVGALREDKERLEKQLDELRNSAATSGSKASSELATIKRRLEEREAEMKKETKQREEAQRSAMDLIVDRHATELQAERAVGDSVKAQGQLRETQLEAEIASITAMGGDQVKSLKDALRKEAEETLVKHNTETSNLKAALAAVTQQIAEMSSQTDGEKGALKGEMSRLESKYSSLQKDLEAKKKEGERAEGVATSLKNQVESLREELKATQKAYQDKMEMSHSKLEEDWKKKMKWLKDSQASELENSLGTLRKAHTADLAEERNKSEREKGALLESLKRVTAEASASSALTGDELANTLSQLQAEKDARVGDVDKLTRQGKQEMQGAEERLLRELMALRTTLTAEADERERLAYEGNIVVLDLMKDMNKKAQEDFKATLAANESTSKFELSEVVREEKMRAEDELSNMMKKQGRTHALDLQRVRDEHDTAVKVLRGEMAVLADIVADLKGLLEQGQRELSEKEASMAAREQQMALQMQALSNEHQQDLERERKKGEKSLSQAMERAFQSEADIKLSFREECAKYETQLKEARISFDTLDKRWRRRESRVEDLSRISSLEDEAAEMTELVAKTKEEMMYFKREMLNREENFNQKFGRSPVVGVMQVFKPKEPGGPATPGSFEKPPMKPSTGGFGGSKSSKPTYSVGGTGVMGMGGMSMGNSAVNSNVGSNAGSNVGSSVGSLNNTGTHTLGSQKGRDDPARRLSHS